MKRIYMILFAMLFLCSSCMPSFSEEKRSADELLQAILTEFSFYDGVIYSDCMDAEYFLTDEMLERMFFDANLADLCYVKSAAVYVSRKWNMHEIIIFELFDPSHRDALLKLFGRREEKKENAIMLCEGNYIFLICTDKNEEIVAWLCDGK